MSSSAAMKALIVDDTPDVCMILERRLTHMGLDVTTADNGALGLTYAVRDRPQLIIVDWMMPGMDGPTLCQHIRKEPTLQSSYVLMLTAQAGTEATAEALDAGADEFLTKPLDDRELSARIRAGLRIATLNSDLADRNATLSAKIVELEVALATISTLEGLLPICAQCKNIRREDRTWEPIECYVMKHSTAQFTHSLCEPCLSMLYPTLYPAEVHQR